MQPIFFRMSSLCEGDYPLVPCIPKGYASTARSRPYQMAEAKCLLSPTACKWITSPNALFLERDAFADPSSGVRAWRRGTIVVMGLKCRLL